MFEKNDTATLHNPFVLFGILLLVVNVIAEQFINVPVAELVILAAIAYAFYHQGGFLKVPYILVAGALSILLVLWVSFVDYYHDADLGSAIRTFSRTFTYYALIVGYILLPCKRNVFHLMVGFMVGHVAYFILQTYLMYLTTSPQAMYVLKWWLPAPSIVILTNFFFKDLFSRGIQRLNIGFFVTILIMSPYISSRGGMISLVVGLLFYIAVRYVRVPSSLLVAASVLLPLMFMGIASVFYDSSNIWSFYDWLVDIDYATSSNVERLLALHSNISIAMDYPLLGVGMKGFEPIIMPYVFELFPERATPLTPHNYYLEFMVPYGVPAMLLVMSILALIYATLVKTMKITGQQVAIALFVSSIIAWAMLTNTGAGYGRLITFYLIFFSFYGLNELNLKKYSAMEEGKHLNC